MSLVDLIAAGAIKLCRCGCGGVIRDGWRKYTPECAEGRKREAVNAYNRVYQRLLRRKKRQKALIDGTYRRKTAYLGRIDRFARGFYGALLRDYEHFGAARWRRLNFIAFFSGLTREVTTPTAKVVPLRALKSLERAGLIEARSWRKKRTGIAAEKEYRIRKVDRDYASPRLPMPNLRLPPPASPPN